MLNLVLFRVVSFYDSLFWTISISLQMHLVFEIIEPVFANMQMSLIVVFSLRFVGECFSSICPRTEWWTDNHLRFAVPSNCFISRNWSPLALPTAPQLVSLLFGSRSSDRENRIHSFSWCSWNRSQCSSHCRYFPWVPSQSPFSFHVPFLVAMGLVISNGHMVSSFLGIASSVAILLVFTVL